MDLKIQQLHDFSVDDIFSSGGSKLCIQKGHLLLFQRGNQMSQNPIHLLRLRTSPTSMN